MSAIYQPNPADDIGEADCIIVAAFGYRGSDRHHLPGFVNHDLAVFALDRSQTLKIPIIAQYEAADVIKKLDGRVAHRVERKKGQYLDTSLVLKEAKRYMKEHNLHAALIVAQAYHVGRVATQAKRLRIHGIVPAGLPETFDPHSRQWWTRSKLLWKLREIPATIYLRITHRL